MISVSRVRRVGVVQVVRRHRADAGRHRRAAGAAELLGVDLALEAVLGGAVAGTDQGNQMGTRLHEGTAGVVGGSGKAGLCDCEEQGGDG